INQKRQAITKRILSYTNQHHYKQFKDVALLQKIFNHSSPYITLRYIGINQDEIDLGYKNFSL
ncbi:MAG: site-specific integrase, partial [Clostridia bacterium]